MRVGIWTAAVVVVLVTQPVSGEPRTIPARVAAGKVRSPTFAEVHRQYMRIVVNESGFKSMPDQDGILRTLIRGGGGRLAGRRKRGQGFGLDYTRLMRMMVRHSGRTFPVGSRYLQLLAPWKLRRIARLRTKQNAWTSTLELDCAQPSGWDESAFHTWRGYLTRCALVAQTTLRFLRGVEQSHCEADPTTWGSHKDKVRPNGPIDRGWNQIFCDRVDACEALSRQELLNSTQCARNTFWSWLELRPVTR